MTSSAEGSAFFGACYLGGLMRESGLTSSNPQRTATSRARRSMLYILEACLPGMRLRVAWSCWGESWESVRWPRAESTLR
ncbi:hypothetical protein HRbin26_00181 [bacterium HR26]|nr:hypothetical protein HRbin26_00181 [bacterium HR26]